MPKKSAVRQMTNALFRLDDSRDPGIARVKLIKKTRIIAGMQCWQIEVLEVVRPSKFRPIRIGQRLQTVSEVHLQKGGEID